MNLTTKQLKQIIKEEVAAVMGEQEGSFQQNVDKAMAYVQEFIDVAEGKKADADGGRSIAGVTGGDLSRPLGSKVGEPHPGDFITRGKYSSTVGPGASYSVAKDRTFEGESIWNRFFGLRNLPDDIESTIAKVLKLNGGQRNTNKPMGRMFALFVDGIKYDEEIALTNVQMPLVLKHAKGLLELLERSRYRTKG